MASDSPETKQSGRPLQQVLPPTMGAADESRGTLVPWEMVSPLIRAEVGQVRAQMEKELGDRLGVMEVKIDGLKGDLQRKPGWGGIWTISGVVISTALVVLGLVYTFVMHGNERAEAGVQLGIELAKGSEDPPNEKQGDREVRPSLEGDGGG